MEESGIDQEFKKVNDTDMVIYMSFICLVQNCYRKMAVKREASSGGFINGKLKSTKKLRKKYLAIKAKTEKYSR